MNRMQAVPYDDAGPIDRGYLGILHPSLLKLIDGITLEISREMMAWPLPTVLENVKQKSKLYCHRYEIVKGGWAEYMMQWDWPTHEWVDPIFIPSLISEHYGLSEAVRQTLDLQAAPHLAALCRYGDYLVPVTDIQCFNHEGQIYGWLLLGELSMDRIRNSFG